MTLTDQILAKYNRTHTATQLAAEIGTTQDRVKSLAYKLRKKGFDVPTKIKPVGFIAVHNGKRDSKRQKQADGTWMYLGSGKPRNHPNTLPIGTVRNRHKNGMWVKTESGWEKCNAENMPKSARKKTAPAIPTGHAGIGPHSKAEGVKTRIVQTRSNTTGRPAYSNGQNPAQVKVREQTGKWVRVDGKTWKLKAA